MQKIIGGALRVEIKCLSELSMNTVFYCRIGNFRDGFIFAKLREKAKSLCHLLMKVNHVIITNFYVANISFNAIRENFRIHSNVVAWVQFFQDRIRVMFKLVAVHLCA